MTQILCTLYFQINNCILLHIFLFEVFSKFLLICSNSFQRQNSVTIYFFPQAFFLFIFLKRMSYRMVRTEQIGPSGHKNEYHIGVLHGNWQEERFALGRKAQGKLRFEGASEASAQFIPRSEN